jgi:citrate lyase subunit beta/citryl-CoA lyase
MTDPRYAPQPGPIGRPGDDPAAPRAAAATSLLFVPADRPERFDNAVATGDLAILDLEAAVADPRKAAARDYVRAWLNAGGRAAVRVNVVESAEHERDLAALEGMPGLLAAVVPLAEGPDTLTSVADRLGAPVIAMVESALGVHRAVELASAEGVCRLAFGSIDFSLDIDAVESPESLLLARSQLVIASRVAGLAAPVDTVTTDISADGPVRDDARRARGLGFSGKFCIHPAQVVPVNSAFRPTSDAVAWAIKVLAVAPSGAAAQVDGHMVDQPVVERARRILDRAERGTGPAGRTTPAAEETR